MITAKGSDSWRRIIADKAFYCNEFRQKKKQVGFTDITISTFSVTNS
jgi:hypothetical protein